MSSGILWKRNQLLHFEGKSRETTFDKYESFLTEKATLNLTKEDIMKKEKPIICPNQNVLKNIVYMGELRLFHLWVL